jgi:predicted amidohydrolase
MKIGILQLDTVWGDPTANFNKIESALRKSSEIPDILLLPEMFDHGYILDPGTVKNLDPEESLAQVRNLAEKYQLAIAGTIPNNRDGKYYNTFIFVEEDGVFATYDKIHLFSPAGEAEAYAEGDEIVEILYQDAVIRPLICYDLRFPYCSWNDTNYDILMYSANWPETRIHHWEALLRARAIENQCYVIGSNRIGKDENGLQYNGQSKIYDYQGNTILNAENSDVLKVVEIDLSAQQAYRNKFPFLQDQK